jgi:hypothetical protein
MYLTTRDASLCLHCVCDGSISILFNRLIRILLVMLLQCLENSFINLHTQIKSLGPV